MNKRITDASIPEIEAGFTYDRNAGIYSCLFCDAQYESGVIYPVGGQYLDACKAAISHIMKTHGSTFPMLLSLDKKYTGLTDVQKDLLLKFYDGEADVDIAKSAGISASTVRYQRFNFREKAKQAKIILALSELLEAKCGRKDDLLKVPEGAEMVDERFFITKSEADKIVKTFFESLTPPVLRQFPVKEKSKLVILNIIAEQFEPSRKYTEKQVNGIIGAIYGDYVTIRRYLIDYGFLDRSAGGVEYWVKEG